MTKRAKKIILDEEKEAKRLLSEPPSSTRYRDLLILSKYFINKGFQKNEIKDKLLEYCESSGVYNYIVEGNILDGAIKKSYLYEFKQTGLKIGITKKECDILKKLSHKDYRIALYILFISKLEKFQKIDRDKKKPKKFDCYFNHEIGDAVYNCSSSKMSKKAIYDLSNRLYKNGILEPILGRNWVYWKILCADFDGKKFEFILDSSVDFSCQIKYYCITCGKQLSQKSKMRDDCNDCYKIRKSRP